MELVFTQVWSPSVEQYIDDRWHPSSRDSIDLSSLFEKWSLLLPQKVMQRLLCDKVLPRLDEEVTEGWLPSDFDLHITDFILNWDSILSEQDRFLVEAYRTLVS